MGKNVVDFYIHNEQALTTLTKAQFIFFREEVERIALILGLSDWSIDVVWINMANEKTTIRQAHTTYDVIKRWATIRLNKHLFSGCNNTILTRLAAHELGHLLTATVFHMITRVRDGWQVPDEQYVELENERLSRAIGSLAVNSCIVSTTDVKEGV